MMKIKEPDNYHKKLTGLLDKAGIYVSRMRSSHGFLLALTITWLVGLLIILENSLFLLGEGFRTLLVLIWLVQAFFFFFWLGLKPLINKPPRRHVALLYEHQYPELDARLVGSWDLLKDRQSSFGYSTNLIDSFAQKAYSVARELDYKKLFPKSTILNTSRWLVLFILITLAFMTITPSFFHKGFARTVNPTAHLLKPTETILTIIPGNYETVKYSQLTVKINAFGTIPDEVEVYRKLDTGATVKFSASKSDGKDQFEYQ
ncbi:hypothetical protein JW877_01145, partial [bacterium]|nr:hypothetical protein [bacterium]